MPLILPYDKKLHTPLGEAVCDLIWISDSLDDQSEYHCWQCETNEPWWWPQKYVRQVGSFTGARHGLHSKIYLSDEVITSHQEAILRHKKSPFYFQAKSIIKVNRGD